MMSDYYIETRLDWWFALFIAVPLSSCGRLSAYNAVKHILFLYTMAHWPKYILHVGARAMWYQY